MIAVSSSLSAAKGVVKKFRTLVFTVNNQVNNRLNIRKTSQQSFLGPFYVYDDDLSSLISVCGQHVLHLLMEPESISFRRSSG